MSVENGTVYMLPYDRAGGKTVAKHQHETGSNDLVGYFGDDPGVPINCPAGSIAVFSSVCFHRSNPNTHHPHAPRLSRPIHWRTIDEPGQLAAMGLGRSVFCTKAPSLPKRAPWREGV